MSLCPSGATGQREFWARAPRVHRLRWDAGVLQFSSGLSGVRNPLLVNGRGQHCWVRNGVS